MAHVPHRACVRVRRSAQPFVTLGRPFRQTARRSDLGTHLRLPPLTVFADHGRGGSGEPLAILLRPGNASSNTAADHIEAIRLALAQLPNQRRRHVLIRTDSGGGTHEFLAWLTKPGRRLSYSIGFTLTEQVQQAVLRLPKSAWTPAYDADRQARPGAWVAELTGLLELPGWPKGMRVIARKERPHPGAQLRFTDVDGCRVTCFVTDAKRGQLADLELRHRRRARADGRIRCAKDTGLGNLPLHNFIRNQIWCELVALACELLAARRAPRWRRQVMGQQAPLAAGPALVQQRVDDLAPSRICPGGT